MATYTRRILYLSDEDWNTLKSWAKEDGTTISEAARGAINIVRTDVDRQRQATEALKGVLRAASHTVDFENSVNDVGRAFRAIRPAPKPSAKRR